MIEVKVPELAESITEGTIAEWLKSVGDRVEKGDNLLELETDKVNLEITAEDSGVLKEIKKEAGDTVEVGEVIAILDENAKEADGAAEEPSGGEKQQETENEQKDTDEKKTNKDAAGTEKTEQTETKETTDERERVIATPAARKLARERGIDLSQVEARDPLGRIRPDDVEAHIQKSAKNNQAKDTGRAVEPATSDSEKPIERRKMSRRRQTIAKRLVDVQHTAAMLTTFNEVDMSAILDIRKRRKESFLKAHDVKLGFMSFFTKAVVGALKQYPLLNAEIQGDEILVKKYYDIGIAVSAKEGLVVPVVRDADKLSFAEIEKEIASLAEKARNNKLQLSDLQGGTFSITNGGIFGSLMSTPILNGPQVGILGMHKIQMRPVAIDEERMENRPMMYIALSYDHRIVDGAEAVSFLVKIKEMLEDPEELLLEG